MSFLAQLFAVVIATGIVYVFGIALKSQFETHFASPLVRQPAQWLVLWCSYLILPLLFSVSGVGLFVVANNQIHTAVLQLYIGPEALDVNINWATALTGGALLLSLLSIAVSRVFIVLFGERSLTSTVFFVGLAGAAVLAAIGYLEYHYSELLLEHIFGLNFLLGYLALGTGVFLAVEGMIWGISHNRLSQKVPQ